MFISELSSILPVQKQESEIMTKTTYLHAKLFTLFLAADLAE